jgi:lysozyme
VVTDMAFNLGVDALCGFAATLAAVRAGRFAEAADHMLQSAWARQVKGRAAELAAMMRTGAR